MNAIDTPSTQLLTVEQVAQQLAVSLSTVYRLVESRQIDCYRIGRSIRFTSEHVSHFLETVAASKPEQTYSHLDL